MNCEYCELQKQKEHLIYADEQVIAAVKDTAVAPGQITVFSKEHFTILEMVPDEVLQKCAAVANKLGMAVFETLGCQGTNVLIQNGLSAGQKVPHFALEIVPRRENDGLKLQWEPQQLMEDEMETTFLMLKEEGEKIVDVGKKPEKKKVEIAPAASNGKIKEEKGKDNYLLKSIKRLP